MNDVLEVEQTRKVGVLSISVRIRYETTGRIDIPSRAAQLKEVATSAVKEIEDEVPRYAPRTEPFGRDNDDIGVDPPRPTL